MSSPLNARYQQAVDYWEVAGASGYDDAMFSSREVARHVNGRIWSLARDMALATGLGKSSRVLDIGCGDGTFANLVLGQEFAEVTGIDLSQAAVARANAAAAAHVHFKQGDLAQLNPGDLPQTDAAFLMGILHHIKPRAHELLARLRESTQTLIILEPNGSNFVRKLLELLPMYRAAGEESFTNRELRALLARGGWEIQSWKHFNFVPNLSPKPLFRLLRALEPLVEALPLLRGCCTCHMIVARPRASN